MLIHSLNLPKTCVFLGYNVNVFIFVHIDADDDFQVPDWHVGQCQSGTWGAPKIQFTTQTYNIAKNTRNLRLGVHAYCSWTYLNGSPFGGFQQVYSDQNNVWYVSNYAWGNYESGGTISVTCLNLPGAGV
uniref:Shufflon protein C n=3 Tax=Escherichia coli TaxID=562 RepID=A0A1Q2TBR9_ECOLX|nr:shufflon protein C [Escherichia coli]